MKNQHYFRFACAASAALAGPFATLYWEFGRHFVGKKLPDNAFQTRSPNICMRKGDWKAIKWFNYAFCRCAPDLVDPTVKVSRRNAAHSEQEEMIILG